MMEVSELIEMLRLARENRDPEGTHGTSDAWPMLEISEPVMIFQPNHDNTDSAVLRNVRRPRQSSASG